MGMTSVSVKENIETVRDIVGSGEVRLIEGTGGTYCMLEEPEKTVAVIAEFLDAL